MFWTHEKIKEALDRSEMAAEVTLPIEQFRGLLNLAALSAPEPVKAEGLKKDHEVRVSWMKAIDHQNYGWNECLDHLVRLNLIRSPESNPPAPGEAVQDDVAALDLAIKALEDAHYVLSEHDCPRTASQCFLAVHKLAALKAAATRKGG